MQTENLCPVYALVLAGGKSRRMKQDKASLVYKDAKPQTQCTFELLSQCCDKVFVSMRAEQVVQAWEIDESKIIRDYKEDLGPMAGIHSAFQYNDKVAWLVLACDLPLLDLSTVENLLKNRKSGQMFLAYKSNYDSLPEPLCAIYEPAAKERIDFYLSQDVRCPRKVLIKENAALLELENKQALENANHPEEFEKFKRILEK